MGEQEVVQITEYLLGFFGYGTEVVDNLLESTDRDVFYMLEEEGLLSTRQEEVLLAPGKLWRLHYWILRIDRVKDILAASEEETETFQALYDSVAEEVWARRPA